MTLSGAFVRSVVAPLWAWKEKSPYLGYLKGLEASKTRPIVVVRHEQMSRFRKLIEHALKNCEYYRSRYSGLSLSPDLLDWDDLAGLPILTKDDIRSRRDAIVASNYRKEELVPITTSGSTGVALSLFIDVESTQWKRAVTMSYDCWSGWELGERVGAIWGNPKHDINWRTRLRNRILDRHVYLDTLKMTEDEMFRFHHALRKKPPRILFGHAHSLYLFARFMEKNGLRDVHPVGIISTCMVLHDFERKAIESVFDCRVTNRYGCEEVSLIACECREGNLHVNCDSLILEFVREDGSPAPPGEPAAIVVTDLTNYAMPLIRYKVGDVGIASTITSCRCGCNYPILQAIEGRVADYIVTPEGTLISGISLTENFATKVAGIKQLQIVQEDLYHIVLRTVRSEEYDESTRGEILSLAGNTFGGSIQVSIDEVESIQSERSGKYRFCISKVENPFS